MSEKTIIHFHQNEMVSEGNKLHQQSTKRTLEIDGHHLHGDVVRMLKDSGYEPLNNRVMLEYV